MNKEPLTRYFTAILKDEPLGTPCHGCYSYAYTLLVRADTWEQYEALLQETQNTIKVLIHMRSSDVKVFSEIYQFIRRVVHDYKKESES